MRQTPGILWAFVSAIASRGSRWAAGLRGCDVSFHSMGGNLQWGKPLIGRPCQTVQRGSPAGRVGHLKIFQQGKYGSGTIICLGPLMDKDVFGQDGAPGGVEVDHFQPSGDEPVPNTCSKLFPSLDMFMPAV